ncbi:unnamed protein product, partial [Symbiodinium sp. KB8]
MQDSLFSPRAAEAEGGSILDTSDILEAAMSADWARAKFKKLMPEESTQFAVRQLIKRRYPMLRDLFRACSTPRSDSGVFGLTMADWTAFWQAILRTAGISLAAQEEGGPAPTPMASGGASGLAFTPSAAAVPAARSMRQADFDNIFISATWQAPTARHPCNPSHLMCRFEFLEAIVRMALVLRVTAVDCFLAEDILPLCQQRLGISVPTDIASNVFRDDVLYTEVVDVMLRQQLPVLCKAFEAFSAPRESDVQLAPILTSPLGRAGGVNPHTRGSKYMRLPDLQALLAEAGLAPALGQLRPQAAFIWSSLTHVDELARSRRQHCVEEHTLLDFAECLVRLAWSCHLPVSGASVSAAVRTVRLGVRRRFGVAAEGGDALFITGDPAEMTFDDVTAYCNRVTAACTARASSKADGMDAWMCSTQRTNEMFWTIARTDALCRHISWALGVGDQPAPAVTGLPRANATFSSDTLTPSARSEVGRLPSTAPPTSLAVGIEAAALPLQLTSQQGEREPTTPTVGVTL